MDLGGLNNHQVHDFARFHAAAAALANGCRHVEVSGPQTRLTIDGRTVQVSSRRQPGSPWQVSAAHPVVDDAAAVIFVDLTGDVPDFYIAPAQWVRSDVKSHFATWLESRGGVRPRNPESDHSTVELDRIRQWHQRWDVLEGRADEDQERRTRRFRLPAVIRHAAPLPGRERVSQLGRILTDHDLPLRTRIAAAIVLL